MRRPLSDSQKLQLLLLFQNAAAELARRQKEEAEALAAAKKQREDAERKSREQVEQEKQAFAAQVEREKAELAAQQQRLHAEREELQRRNDDVVQRLQRELAEAKADANWSRETAERHRKDVDLYREEMEKHQAAAASSSKKQSSELNDARGLVLELKDKVRTLTDECAALREEIATANMQLEVKETEFQCAQTELEQAKLQFGNKDERIGELEAAIAAKGETAKAEAEKRRAAEREVEDAKYKIASLERGTKQLQEVCSATADENRRRIADLEASVRRLKDEVAEEKSSRESVGIELDFTKKKLEESRLREQELVLAAEATARLRAGAGGGAANIKAGGAKSAASSTSTTARASPTDVIPGGAAPGAGTVLGVPVDDDNGRATIANHMEFLAGLEKSKRLDEDAEVSVDGVNVQLDDRITATSTTEGGATPSGGGVGTSTSATAADLRRRIQEKTRELAETKAAFADLNTEYNIKREENRRVLTELRQLETTNQRLELQVQNMVAADEAKALRTKLADLEGVRDRLTFSVANLEKQRFERDGKIEALEKDLEEKRRANQELQVRITEVERRAELEKEYGGSSTTAAKSASSNANAKAVGTKAGAGDEELLVPGASGGQDRDHELREQVEELQVKASKAERNYEAMKSVQAQYKEMLQQQMLDLRKKNEELRRLRTVAERVEREKEEMEDELKTLREEGDKLEGTNKYYVQKVGEQREELTKMRQENKQLQSDRIAEKLELDKKTVLVNQLRAKNEELLVGGAAGGAGVDHDGGAAGRGPGGRAVTGLDVLAQTEAGKNIL
eukprot:g5406.t1